MCQAKNIVGKS